MDAYRSWHQPCCGAFRPAILRPLTPIIAPSVHVPSKLFTRRDASASRTRVIPADASKLGHDDAGSAALGPSSKNSPNQLGFRGKVAVSSTSPTFSAQVMLKSAINQLEHMDPSGYDSEDYSELHSDDDSLGNQTGEPAAYALNKATYEVLRLDRDGRTRQFYVRRRDLLREHRIQPRDLRRIDPAIDFTKTSPSITIKENAVLLCIGGVRAICTAEKVLLLEPSSPSTRKFLDIVIPHLKSRGSAHTVRDDAAIRSSHNDYMSRFYRDKDQDKRIRSPPFELEVLEGALMVATGRLDAEMLAVTKRVEQLLTKLPRDINPVNLEELRRVKGALVELENKADTVRNMLEELMDDEDELRELNLSSRPRREERRRLRERERLERELERAREIKEELTERLEDGDDNGQPSVSSTSSTSSTSSSDNGNGNNGNGNGSVLAAASSSTPRLGPPSPGLPVASDGSIPLSPAAALAKFQRQDRMAELRAKFDRERLAELRSKFGWTNDKDKERENRDRDERDRERDRTRRRDDGDEDWISRLEGSEEDIQEAQEALEEMVEQEEEEEELEEVEDLLEYYLQRSSAIQSEAERLLEGARDLEESIGVSLSARRYEVNRLELTLSIGSFAAAIGAMIAGIFGMNMKSTLEMSVWAFWGVAGLIVMGCFYMFMAIMRYTQRKKIL